ncbi:MAG: hypothetical protein ACXAC2_19190 [Candidatus Kariarchaeaceae archaeon]|jgi:hypothetical protein
MKRKIYLIFMLFIIPVNIIVLSIDTVISTTISGPALKNLPAGWTVETLYEKPVTPSSICVDGNGDLLMLDPLKYSISKLDPTGNISFYASTGSRQFGQIAFQPNENRLLGFGGTPGGLYAYMGGTFVLINTIDPDKEVTSSIVVDPTDDSFYGGSFNIGTKICHFNATGHFIREIVVNVQGCGQIALNKSQNVLYYTEAYTGSVYRVNLTDLSSTMIEKGLGIPSIGEPPVICLDDNQTLYSLHKNGTTNQGLYKLVNDSFVFLGMPDKYGWGNLHWAPKFQSILLAASAGGCIASYNLAENTITKLTDIVNSPAIVENEDGEIFLSIESQIMKLTSIGLVNITKDLPYEIMQFALDAENNIAYRIPIADYDLYEPILIPTITGSVPRGTVDNDGTVYIYENEANLIYKIPDTTTVAEILFTNVHYKDPFFFLQYISKVDGLIGGWNDGLRMFPLSSGAKYSFAESDTGIDFQSLFETKNKEYIGTHTRHIYRITYNLGSRAIPGFEWVTLLLSLIALVYVSYKRYSKRGL